MRHWNVEPYKKYSDNLLVLNNKNSLLYYENFRGGNLAYNYILFYYQVIHGTKLNSQISKASRFMKTHTPTHYSLNSLYLLF